MAETEPTLFQLTPGESSAPLPYSAVARSPKQKAVLRYLQDNETITLAQAVTLIGGTVYANANFHVGNTMGAMVKRGLIKRVKRGVFALPNAEDQ